MLELRNVSAANRGITQLNFSVAAGEIVALIGRNGAGKTTLLRLALGLIHPTAGTVHRTVGNGDIGQLIDAPFCYSELTVSQNLRMHAWLYGIDPERIADSINQWELQPYRDRLFRKLSLGNKQRVGLAGAFQHQPRLIVLDEPTNALDPMGIVTLRTVVKERAAAGCGVVVSSHHLDEVAAIAHRIVVVNSGRIITELSPTTPQLENRFFQAILSDDQSNANADT
ncbi:ABC transporter ATP-binding protein [Corynebacterium durum]|uniref:ABC transporter ATP-binding protein n=1 Tax=Corynebacterium durum TaxID=61592 RepID=UPI0015CE87B8|nr:ABC transporter ATP-binding protein [Corynebacterium durum]NYI72875.1 ABC-2 type transport system ATP-binding protein [Corynebacterium durum]WJY84603.1 SkfA peptide export ATP-binding protein SkfE [Corynebacterium durum]